MLSCTSLQFLVPEFGLQFVKHANQADSCFLLRKLIVNQICNFAVMLDFWSAFELDSRKNRKENGKMKTETYIELDSALSLNDFN